MSHGYEWNGWPSFGLRLGRNLRAVRRKRGLTQDDLAALTGLARNTISNIERNLGNADTPGDPQLSNLYRLARALDVPPAVLLPAGGEVVADICPATGLGIDLRWPAETQLEPFRDAYVLHGQLPRYESEVAREIHPTDPGEVESEDERPAIEGEDPATE
ncbi:helix-turn-helix domain-containing protein [Corynebacterium sp.]|uniref:helix-turn-helix domain-containing protein n=1 Tax=Corynebacterium sp. TaxID=1720 RepID=UPI0026E0EC1D|nr:helix-turn-helix transcriptional regulator [Corynebacterium sp.]MDO5512662.1 helix-turn-helix transcriptional regulator [Corynebacterium sp.]